MRSAQTHLCAWAIMKKFIYVCNEKHYMFPLLCIYNTIQLWTNYEQAMKMLLIFTTM